VPSPQARGKHAPQTAKWTQTDITQYVGAHRSPAHTARQAGDVSTVLTAAIDSDRFPVTEKMLRRPYMVTAGATANTTEGNEQSRASRDRESGF